MKRTILLITVITMTLLLLPVALFAGPKDYLDAEGCSYGHNISQEAKAEAIKAKAREGRFLQYRDEIGKLSLDTSEEQTAIAEGSRLTRISNPRTRAGDDIVAANAGATNDVSGGREDTLVGAVDTTGGVGNEEMFGGGKGDITPTGPFSGVEVPSPTDEPAVTSPSSNNAGGGEADSSDEEGLLLRRPGS